MENKPHPLAKLADMFHGAFQRHYGAYNGDKYPTWVIRFQFSQSDTCQQSGLGIWNLEIEFKSPDCDGVIRRSQVMLASIADNLKIESLFVRVVRFELSDRCLAPNWTKIK